MLHKFCAWAHLSIFNQSEHKNWTWSVTNTWPWLEKVFPACILKNWLNFCLWGQFEIKIVIGRGDTHINTPYLIWILKKSKREPAIIWKRVNCQRITSKKYSTLMGRHLSPRYGQVILVSGYSVLTAVNWWQHWCKISSLLGSQSS